MATSSESPSSSSSPKHKDPFGLTRAELTALPGHDSFFVDFFQFNEKYVTKIVYSHLPPQWYCSQCVKWFSCDPISEACHIHSRSHMFQFLQSRSPETKMKIDIATLENVPGIISRNPELFIDRHFLQHTLESSFPGTSAYVCTLCQLHFVGWPKDVLSHVVHEEHQDLRNMKKMSQNPTPENIKQVELDALPAYVSRLYSSLLTHDCTTRPVPKLKDMLHSLPLSGEDQSKIDEVFNYICCSFQKMEKTQFPNQRYWDIKCLICHQKFFGDQWSQLLHTSYYDHMFSYQQKLDAQFRIPDGTRQLIHHIAMTNMNEQIAQIEEKHKEDSKKIRN